MRRLSVCRIIGTRAATVFWYSGASSMSLLLWKVQFLIQGSGQLKGSLRELAVAWGWSTSGNLKQLNAGQIVGEGSGLLCGFFGGFGV